MTVFPEKVKKILTKNYSHVIFISHVVGSLQGKVDKTKGHHLCTFISITVGSIFGGDSHFPLVEQHHRHAPSDIGALRLTPNAEVKYLITLNSNPIFKMEVISHRP